MRVLVTGAGGMLGAAVADAAAARGHEVVALPRAELDVTEAAAVRRAVADAAPDAVVHCAAWTDVDGAEANEARATAVNGTGAGHVASAAARAHARSVHVSTDYVFDGRSSSGYIEDDEPRPLSAYGRSKLAGERAVAAAAEDHAIVRTAWLFGTGGRNFVDTVLGLARDRDELRVVDDQVGSPTWVGHLAPALVEIAEGEGRGVLHVAAAGRCSWHDLAAEAFARAGLDCRAVPTTSTDFPRPAPRPACSVLRSTRRDAPRLPPWQEGLAAHLASRPLPAEAGPLRRAPRQPIAEAGR
jgi:dTDP-4-dehydrorhamnose reductase